MDKQQLKDLEKQLWAAADNLRANAGLRASQYSTPVLGLIFLKFADNKYKRFEAEIQQEYDKHKGKRTEKKIAKIAIEKCGFYLPEKARYDYLLNLPGKEDTAAAIKNAMALIEEHKPELDGVLPQDEYFKLYTDDDRSIPGQLLRNFKDIPEELTGDLFGKIYEYFLGNFALAEGQGGGEFFTPESVVRLMVEIIEPHGGTVYDPACGSGGMFVQSAHFVEQHRNELANEDNDASVFVYGQEKEPETVKLAKMNLAVNGLRGDIKPQNSYYSDPHGSFGKFDYVLANPPFNVDDVNYDKIKDDKRFNTYGIPRKKTKAKKADAGTETVPNGNYLWINLFATSLKEKGRAGLVMANSASDARHSEADIRQSLIENNLIYGMLTLPSNMFYTVTLPATLWFFDKNKQDDRLLFIDSRNIFTQIDRAHREFSDAQIQNIAIISKLHKGNLAAFIDLIDSYFAKGMALLQQNQQQVKPVCEQLGEVLADAQGKAAVKQLLNEWSALKTLQTAYEKYQKAAKALKTIKAKNKAQQTLRESFDPFFESLHSGLKQLDKIVRKHEKQKAEIAKQAGKRTTTDRETKKLKDALELLHKEVKNAEIYYQHIHWLQVRFPHAEYEDVTGLCKLATQAEIKEQDYSLNPGRYVGVVIEEDGKTEEEFISGIVNVSNELKELTEQSTNLESVIYKNIEGIIGE
ncbi:MAG: N-6 DNA methylase [Thiotrichaceae bacterium]|nr:MAG: N-6 DNA methylase [Thiotrichaceae bacterium]